MIAMSLSEVDWSIILDALHEAETQWFDDVDLVVDLITRLEANGARTPPQEPSPLVQA